MAYPVEMERGVQSDQFERTIAMTLAGPVVNGEPTRVPLPLTDLATIRATYPTLEAVFSANVRSATPLFTLVSANGGVRIEDARRTPSGLVTPAVVLTFLPEHTDKVIQNCAFFVRFLKATGPYTWVYGSWGVDPL